MKRSNKKEEQKKIAKKRIKTLFLLAENNALEGKLSLSNRYVQIARKISMRCLVPIPPEFKRRFCKHCYSYLLPSVNSRYRIHDKRLVIFCFNCKKYTRFPLKNKEKQ